jgi:hypothetical protein
MTGERDTLQYTTHPEMLQNIGTVAKESGISISTQETLSPFPC